MSMTLQCDKCKTAHGKEMHGVEIVYGFCQPEIKMGGHFCAACYKEHVAPLFEQLRFVIPTEPVAPNQGQGMPPVQPIAR